MGYFLGLDGGGTKTHIALYNSETGLLDLYTGGGSNYENMPGGYAELTVVLTEMLGKFLGGHGITAADIGRAAFGMAGVDTIKQHGEISKILANLGFANFDLDNDCILGVKAATSHGYGIACVCGTGFSVLGIDENGNQMQVGGMGMFTGDKGGGGYVTNEGTSYVYGQLFKGYPVSAMTDMFMDAFDIAHKNDFMETVHARFYNGDSKAFSLAVCKIVFKAADMGDTAAVNILAKSARCYGESVLGILNELSFESAPPEIVLTGSLPQKNPKSTLVTAFEAYLKQHYQKPFVLKVLDAPSVLGALVWALDKDGEGIITDQKRREFSEKLQNISASV